ncbi:MAG: hypothetical protein DRH08_00285 [Deltaproteobacteria bacterium]|nr:MAG: hypothetical protein DRH08_00285 [Deltaproteobacteria bacterium]
MTEATTEASSKGTSRKTPGSKSSSSKKAADQKAADQKAATAAAEGNATPESTPESTPSEGSSADSESDKKKNHRRSVFVCIPVEWAEVAVSNPETGDMTAERQPTRYQITECPGGNGQKAAILAALAQNDIDPINYDAVLMFRADPLKFEISQQTIIRI